MARDLLVAETALAWETMITEEFNFLADLTKALRRELLTEK